MLDVTTPIPESFPQIPLVLESNQFPPFCIRAARPQSRTEEEGVWWVTIPLLTRHRGSLFRLSYRHRAEGGSRTHNILPTKQALFQLSYPGTISDRGVEPRYQSL